MVVHQRRHCLGSGSVRPSVQVHFRKAKKNITHSVLGLVLWFVGWLGSPECENGCSKDNKVSYSTTEVGPQEDTRRVFAKYSGRSTAGKVNLESVSVFTGPIPGKDPTVISVESGKSKQWGGLMMERKQRCDDG